MVSSFALAGAADRDISKELTDRYRSKIFALRYPLLADSQHYDFNGKPLQSPPEGSWTLFGRIIVDKISVKGDELRVAGHRAVYGLNPNMERQGKNKKRNDNAAKVEDDGPLVPFADTQKVEIGIRLVSPLASSRDAEAVLGRVFGYTQKDLIDAVPPYWRHYFETHAKSAEGNTQRPQEQKPETAQPADAGERGRATEVGGEPIVHLGAKGVTAPKPLFTPEPAFTEAARKARYQGVATFDVVVDKTGRVGEVQVVRPLGLGLDDAAVRTIQTWRFSPAKLDGNSAACQFNVEVDFRLYDNVP